MKVSTVLSDDKMRRKRKMFGNHDEYLTRITKSLYYAQVPKSERTSLPVTELAAEIFSATKNKLSLDYLDTEEAANLSCNACVSPCTLVLALLYLDRLKASNPKYLAKVTPSELFLISLLIGSKFLQDDGEDDEVNNDEWASSAGISVQDINRAEREFLSAIDWEVYVSEEAFWKQLKILEQSVSLREGCKRGGWFTYTDLHSLLAVLEMTNVITTLLTVTSVCLASYTASVLTLVGSTALVSQVQTLGYTHNMYWTTNNDIINNSTQQHLDDIVSSLDLDYSNSNISDKSSYWSFWNNWRSNCGMFNFKFPFKHLPAWPVDVKNDLIGFSSPMINWVDLVKECLTKRSMYTDMIPLVSY